MPGVSRGDRLAVWGGVSCAVELVGFALGELGASYRPLGELGLVRAVAAKLEGVVESAEFSWMSLSAGDLVPWAGEGAGVGAGVGWLGPVEEGRWRGCWRWMRRTRTRCRGWWG
ncbi:hypothetical protein ACFQYP_21370 [Nonomuraea antimicrobica]